MAERTVKLEIKRQSGTEGKAHWDAFEIPYKPGMNVISAMMDIAANPVTADGKETTPIAYDSNCLEEVCGSCSMRINGKARMACSALVDKLEQPIKLEPLSKFPVVRDLAVDRSVLFENLKRRQGMGARRWQLRPGRWPAAVSAVAGRALSALPMHLLHHLHGGLPAVY